jgi:TM2 domain-containing membrane protein YozV
MGCQSRWLSILLIANLVVYYGLNRTIHVMAEPPIPGAEKKIAAGICGILLGCFGVHKFILGYTNEGIIMLAVSLVGLGLSCLVLPGIAPFAMGVIGLVEGIIYLTQTDEEFVNTYINGRKPWF